MVNCGSDVAAAADVADDDDVVMAVKRCGRKRGRMLWKAA